MYFFIFWAVLIIQDKVLTFLLQNNGNTITKRKLK